MSDVSQGPGWWQASDGKWYPPQPPPPGAPSPQPPPAGAPSDGPKQSRKKWPFVVGAVVVVVIVIAVVAGSSKKSPSTTATTTTVATGSHSPASSTTTTAASGNGSSPSSPIPLGQSANVEGWKVKVVSVTPEATDPVTGGPPPAGYLFEVFTLQTTRTDSSPESPIILDPVLVGPTKDQRGADSNPQCYGGTPYNDEVDQGGTVQTSACISIPTNDTTGLALGVGIVNQTWFATS